MRPALTVSDHERDAEIERLLADWTTARLDLVKIAHLVGRVMDQTPGAPHPELRSVLTLCQRNLAPVAQVQSGSQRAPAPGSTPTDGGVSQSESDDGLSPSSLRLNGACSQAAPTVVGSSFSDPAEGASARKPDGGCLSLTTPSAGSPSSCPRCVDLLWRAVGPRMAAELVGLRAQITAHLESDHA